MLNHTLKMGLDDKRHLVVGDLHGYFDEFMQLLDRVNYDPAKDNVYCVGDLIDRGPKSVEVVEQFQKPGFYAVKGNHEIMALDTEWYDTWINNGGAECLASCEAHNVHIKWIKDHIRDLPLIIDVGDDDEKHAFRIVHAEIPPAWPESFLQATLDQALNVGDTTMSRIFWSRKMFNAAMENLRNNLPADNGLIFHEERYRTVFTGHTPTPLVVLCGDHYFLDTGYHSGLSMIDAVTKEVTHVTIDNYNRN